MAPEPSRAIRRLATLALLLALTPASRAETPPEATAPPTTAADFEKECRRNLDAVAALRDAIRALGPADPGGFALRHHNEIFMVIDRVARKTELFAALHPDPAVQAVARTLRDDAARLHFSTWQDPTLLAALERHGARTLGDEERRALTLSIEIARRHGARLDDASRAKAREIDDRIRRLASAPKDFALLPKSEIASGFLALQLRERSPARRKSAYEALFSMPEPEVLRAAAALCSARRELAALFRLSPGELTRGGATPEHWITRDDSFVEEISAAALVAWRREQKTLLESKRADEPDAAVLEPWDVRYYRELLRDGSMSSRELRDDDLRPYLELECVEKGLLAVAAASFGLRFDAAKETTWHASVKCYNVFDASEPKRRIGVLFLDLVHRGGKAKGPAYYWMQAGVAASPLPHAVVSLHLSSSAGGRTTLGNAEMRGLLRAFGGALHLLLAGREHWYVFSESCRDPELREATALLVESWLDDARIAVRIAGDGSASVPLSVARVEAARRSWRVGRGLDALDEAQRLLAYRDLLAAEIQPERPEELFAKVEALHAPRWKEHGTRPVETWRQIVLAGGEPWESLSARALAADIATEFVDTDTKQDLANREVALRYRRLVIEPGARRAASASIEEFLGRPHTLEAWKKSLER